MNQVICIGFGIAIGVLGTGLFASSQADQLRSQSIRTQTSLTECQQAKDALSQTIHGMLLNKE